MGLYEQSNMRIYFLCLTLLLCCITIRSIYGFPRGSSAHFGGDGDDYDTGCGAIRVFGTDFRDYPVLSIGAWINFNRSCVGSDCQLFAILSTKPNGLGAQYGAIYGIGHIVPTLSSLQLFIETVTVAGQDNEFEQYFTDTNAIKESEWMYVYFERHQASGMVNIVVLSNDTSLRGNYSGSVGVPIEKSELVRSP
mmetsp:Transcript_631/g.760  ORF Transcript_631/g.760 Transcript_631/m.760 type:complete len:194 (-) Transcript_631:1080-1661(-)